MSRTRVYVAVIGVGGVGSAFLSQLATIQPSHPSLSLVLVSRSSKCLFVEDFAHGLSATTWARDLAASSQPVFSLVDVREYLSASPGKCILVDNTSSQDVADAYPAFLSRGISIVTPNKKAFSGSAELWADVFAAAQGPASPLGGLVYHEASVGAGLPVISTLNDLVATGDEVTRIEGVFSGTLSFLFNSFAPLQGEAAGKWSDEVKRARELGYTEPDPRDDLNGLDVARKLVILARLAGLKVQGTDAFPVQSLIPKELEGAGSGEDFLARLPEFDDGMETVKKEAEAEGKIVRFVGSIDLGKGDIRVGLERFDRGHPVAGLRGGDNIINFYTKRYGERPLIIQGAGAGGELTAMGVTSDLLKVLQRLETEVAMQ